MRKRPLHRGRFCLSAPDGLARLSIAEFAREQMIALPYFDNGVTRRVNVRMISGGGIGLKREKLRALGDAFFVLVSDGIIHCDPLRGFQQAQSPCIGPACHRESRFKTLPAISLDFLFVCRLRIRHRRHDRLRFGGALVCLFRGISRRRVRRRLGLIRHFGISWKASEISDSYQLAMRGTECNGHGANCALPFDLANRAPTCSNA